MHHDILGRCKVFLPPIQGASGRCPFTLTAVTGSAFFPDASGTVGTSGAQHPNPRLKYPFTAESSAPSACARVCATGLGHTRCVTGVRRMRASVRVR